MSKKVYMVLKLFHNVTIEEAINWPYIDCYVEKLFASREDAEKWVDSRFTTFLNEDANFYDLQIVEKDVENGEGANANGCAPAIGFWVSARIAVTVRGGKVVEMDFRKERGDEEKEYWIDEGEIRVFYKLPPFCTRTEVVEFVEKKVGEFIKKK